MGKATSDSSSEHLGAGQFPPTHWTVVMDAGKDSSLEARGAFGELYRAYLPPLLAFLRRNGKTEEEARDLAQGFFEFLLEKGGLGKVRKEGRFRNWLLVCLKRYLSDLWDRARAAKRGGGQHALPLDGTPDEPGIDAPHPGRTPDEEYEHTYALRFLELVMERLGREYQARGKALVFETLCPFLLDKKISLSHADLGRQLGMSEDAVSTEISRLRKRYRALFDQELLKLVETPEQLEDEKQFLFAALTK